MNDKQESKNDDLYELLHKGFSLSGSDSSKGNDEPDVKNSGEIYFSANSTENRRTPSEEYDFDRYLPGVRTDRPKSSGSVQSTRRNDTVRYNSGGLNTQQQSTVNSRSSYESTKTAYDNLRNVKANENPTKVAPVSRTATSNENAAGNVSRIKPEAVKHTSNTGKKKKKKKSKKQQSSSVSLLLAACIVVFVLVASLLIRVPVMGCVSDILAIDRDSTEIRVILEESTKTNQVINILKDKDLISNAAFCKMVSGFLGYDSSEVFPAGTYYLSADMGLEGMLRTIMSAGAVDLTVTVTLPEGFTVDQIVEKLAQNGVASENALYAALDDDSLYEEFDFLSSITDKEQRYRALEGYLYPDTYEFYVDENPVSVFRRFLKNFEEKWAENFAADFEGSQYTIDEIMTVASILEKEANDAEQMPLIASILYNRINSSSFPWINCDSTAKYIEQYREKLEAEGTYVDYLKLYDTYQVTGLPIGPICNPGEDAIKAAISPDKTDYYYFLHDSEGKIYTARTESEHQANQQYMDDAG